MADATYQPGVYRQQGGNKLIAASGGEIEFQSGSTLDIQSGTTFTNAATLTQTGNVNFGVDGTGVDVSFFGDTASVKALWDQSADSFILNDNAKLVFGTGSDVTAYWDATNLIIAAAADDSVIEIGDAAATQKSFDLKVYGNAANGADYWLFDASASALVAGGDSRVDLSSATVAAANTDGGLIKAGTSGARVVEDTANMKFMSFYLDNGATSGDNRGMYLRQYLTGAGGGGEALRVFTDVENVAGGTAHGAHISLKFGTTGSITGLGVANRNTLHVPDAMTGGSYYVNQQEIWADAATSDLAGTTNQAFLNFNLGGDSTGLALIEDTVNLIHLTGGSIAASNLMAAKTAAAVTHTIRMKGPDGSTYYLMVSDTQ